MALNIYINTKTITRIVTRKTDISNYKRTMKTNYMSIITPEIPAINLKFNVKVWHTNSSPQELLQTFLAGVSSHECTWHCSFFFELVFFSEMFWIPWNLIHKHSLALFPWTLSFWGEIHAALGLVSETGFSHTLSPPPLLLFFSLSCMWFSLRELRPYIFSPSFSLFFGVMWPPRGKM